jgi:hypothetical protein
MRPELRFSDPETDEAMRLPGRKVFLAVGLLGLLMLGLAAFSSGRVAPSPQRSPAAAKSIEIVPSPSGGFEQDGVLR